MCPELSVTYCIRAAKQYLRTCFNIDAQGDVIDILTFPYNHSPRDVSVEQSKRLQDIVIALLNTDLVQNGGVTDKTKWFMSRRFLTYFTHIPPYRIFRY